MSMCHEEIGGGHLGTKKTTSKVVERFKWPNMHLDITNWVKSCAICSRRKGPLGVRGLQVPHEVPETPFEKIGIDFIGPLPRTERGNAHILVICDYTSRWPEAFATTDQKATTVSKVLMDEWICRYGAPTQLLSDQGQNFLSGIVREICDLFKTRKLQTTAYHPATNGLTERFNKTLCAMLSAYVSAHQRDWDVYLPTVLFAYRVAVQESSRRTPFELVYGRQARLPNDLDIFVPKTTLVRDIQRQWRDAVENITKHAAKSKASHDDKYKCVKYSVGDWVRINKPATPIGLKRKLRGDWWGEPREVVEVNTANVCVKGPDGKVKWIHVERVKPVVIARGIHKQINDNATARGESGAIAKVVDEGGSSQLKSRAGRPLRKPERYGDTN